MDKFQQSQKDKLFKPTAHDPYHVQRVAGSAVCAQCGALYHAGNWTWNRPENAVVDGAETETCPACRRIHDQVPAGTLRLSGSFVLEHREDIIHLIENTEEKEKAEHALERIMQLSDAEGDLLVTTTGIHLANRLGHALEAAFKGHADYQYADDQYGVNVSWERNE